MTINAVVKSLDECSEGNCRITFPYATIYRLLDKGYIVESEKRVSDNRRRQFYSITDSGRAYFADMYNEYSSFIDGVNMIFSSFEKDGADR